MANVEWVDVRRANIELTDVDWTDVRWSIVELLNMRWASVKCLVGLCLVGGRPGTLARVHAVTRIGSY